MGGKNSYASIKRYQDKAYDTLTVRALKGQRSIIKDHAASRGESVNAFINRAIREAMDRDTGAGPVAAGLIAAEPERVEAPGHTGTDCLTRFRQRTTLMTEGGTPMEVLSCRVNAARADAFQAFCAENGTSISRALKSYVCMCLKEQEETEES